MTDLTAGYRGIRRFGRAHEHMPPNDMEDKVFPLPRISLVIFDMDGLMLDTERLALAAWETAGREYGFAVPPSVVAETVGLDKNNTQKVFQKLLGDEFPFHEIRKRRIEHANRVIEKEGVPVKKGLHEILAFLKKKGVLTAVATSTERARAEKLLSQAGVIHMFDAVVCGDEAPKGKPEPDIFLAVSEKLKCIPAECMVLEDSDPGIMAASRAGMIPILIPDIRMPSEEAERLAYMKFPSLLEAKEFMEKIIL